MLITSALASDFKPTQIAANQGDAKAQFEIGFMYAHSKGTARNYDKAIDWYIKAADQGDIGTKVNLGFMYEVGEGITQDKNKAKNLYKQSCDDGYQPGCNYYIYLDE